MVHANILILALKYWRSLRKAEEELLDEEYHFLQFKPQEFQQHFQQIKDYALKANPFTPTLEPGTCTLI